MAHSKSIKTVNDEAEERAAHDGEGAQVEDDDGIQDGEEATARDFEYLLGMPMWSVTEERVNQIVNLMNQKKQEHDTLQVKHIHEIWTEDLDAFIFELKRVWAQEEQERLRLGGVKASAKGKRKTIASAKKSKPALKQSELGVKKTTKLVQPKVQMRGAAAA